ncbi:MAG TPA: hypothetical protein VIT44_19735 [Cyclobacteriaceae bacterium]
MKLVYCIILIVMVTCNPTMGQSVNLDSAQNNNKVHYFYSVQTGALIGDQVTFTASTIHGVVLREKLRLGGGIGFDSFEDANTMPVFGSLSMDVLGKANVVFVQATYGWAPLAWSPALKNEYAFKKVKGGEDFSLMLGYRVTNGDIRIALLAGLKHQEVQIKYEYPAYYPWSGLFLPKEQTYNTQVIKETMNRLAVSLSVGWR